MGIVVGRSAQAIRRELKRFFGDVHATCAESRATRDMSSSFLLDQWSSLCFLSVASVPVVVCVFVSAFNEMSVATTSEDELANMQRQPLRLIMMRSPPV